MQSSSEVSLGDLCRECGEAVASRTFPWNMQAMQAMQAAIYIFLFCFDSATHSHSWQKRPCSDATWNSLFAQTSMISEMCPSKLSQAMFNHLAVFEPALPEDCHPHPSNLCHHIHIDKLTLHNHSATNIHSVTSIYFIHSLSGPSLGKNTIQYPAKPGQKNSAPDKHFCGCPSE